MICQWLIPLKAEPFVDTRSVVDVHPQDCVVLLKAEFLYVCNLMLSTLQSLYDMMYGQLNNKPGLRRWCNNYLSSGFKLKAGKFKLLTEC
jgi:hypothetical protein